MFDVNGDNHLNFLETVLLAHVQCILPRDLSSPRDLSRAFPFPFQYRVMQSMLDVDMDNDKHVELSPKEFEAWYRKVHKGELQFHVESFGS